MSIKTKLQGLITEANTTTGESDTNLTDAVASLIDGYGGSTPTGTKTITDTSLTDVADYANAQVVDADLVAGNIKKGVNILGVTGTFEGGGGGKKVEGSFTPASDITSKYIITTVSNLGFTPKAFVVRTDPADKKGGMCLNSFFFNDEYGWLEISHYKQAGSSKDSGDHRSGSDMSSFVDVTGGITVGNDGNISIRPTSSYKLVAEVTYYWYAYEQWGW